MLAETLASVATLQIPEGIEPECLIVDNNSTDETSDVVERFARHASIAVRYVVEPRMGSSYARNRAVATSDCDYIFFIDDDAIADPDWAMRCWRRSSTGSSMRLAGLCCHDGKAVRRHGWGRASTAAWPSMTRTA